ncbi:hypothetical protein FI667_g5026, partial [Globisporangium splendens]
MSDGFCVIHVDGWQTWWAETRHGSVKVYVSIVLFFLSAVLAHPIARSIFFLLRKFSPNKWKWPDEARELMMWQTALVCRAGLLWIAVVVSRVSIFLCQWPGWLFGICFIIWVDAGGNVLRELAKMLLLVFVVYTYYLAPVIGDDSAARVVVSTGFFLAIALHENDTVEETNVRVLCAFLFWRQMRNVMGAHYMFLTNMLHLDTHINVEGRSKGSVCDAPLGFIVLKTDNNTKTFIPAGGTVTSLTSVYHSHFWPLKLDIRLPPETPAVQVRMFMQELDQLLFWDGRFLPRLATASVFEPPPPALLAANRSNRSSSVGQTHGDDTSKMLFELNLQEENQVVQRARGDDSYIALQANERWVIHFSIFIKGKRKPRFRQIRAAYIDAITRLLEQQGIGYAGQQQPQITPSSYT